MKNLLFFLIGSLVLLLALRWGLQLQPGGEHTGAEYMPDMAHSRAYDVYYPAPGTGSDILTEVPDYQLIAEPLFADTLVARKPVAGTVPRGFKPYPYQNTESGYEMAGAGLLNPYWDADDITLKEGRNHYTIYCEVCHGAQGKGMGSISASSEPAGPFAGIPNYFAAAYEQMPEGKMFHSIHYGKNNMGSYASQLTKDERWKVVSYIKDMQATNAAKSKSMDKDEAMNFVRGTAVNLGPKSPDGTPLKSALSSMKNKALEKGTKVVLDNVFFDTGSYDLRAESYYELDLLAEILSKNKSARVEISGHTDSDGDAQSNLELSQNRAAAAYGYLKSIGITSEQIMFKGYGQNRPVAENDTPENKQKNRRVEFEVLEVLELADL